VKLTYDPRYNVAYIRLREKGFGAETIRVSDELNRPAGFLAFSAECRFPDAPST
jgi:hypothetical protein